MKITTDHPASSYGLPVILDDAGNPLDYAAGVQALRRTLGLSVAELGQACGRSKRTAEGWEQGRAVPAECLLVMAGLLKRHGRKRTK